MLGLGPSGVVGGVVVVDFYVTWEKPASFDPGQRTGTDMSPTQQLSKGRIDASSFHFSSAPTSFFLNEYAFFFFFFYLSRCEGPSVQQRQQAAEHGGADGGGRAPSVPHQVGEQDVAQELLGLVAETSAGRKSCQRSERRDKTALCFGAKLIVKVQSPHN